MGKSEDKAAAEYYKKHGPDKFDRQCEKEMKSHKELPNGRNFHTFNQEFDPEADERYRDNYDKIKWNTKKKYDGI